MPPSSPLFPNLLPSLMSCFPTCFPFPCFHFLKPSPSLCSFTKPSSYTFFTSHLILYFLFAFFSFQLHPSFISPPWLNTFVLFLLSRPSSPFSFTSSTAPFSLPSFTTHFFQISFSSVIHLLSNPSSFTFLCFLLLFLFTGLEPFPLLLTPLPSPPSHLPLFTSCFCCST